MYKKRSKKKKFGFKGPLHMTKAGRHGKRGERQIARAEKQRDME